ncbi:hypothetical protein NKR23_g10899 [Pleurostoma richardsiae]|uniref:Uncharacterized protein n=1 Tax=Pleurostoma richardsiae TaxID=41990 RepID=A0AA38R4E1_9PEZI|nr:hypothetical protein NKR23_g10899 [Pleurostoma richardsiae]
MQSLEYVGSILVKIEVLYFTGLQDSSDAAGQLKKFLEENGDFTTMSSQAPHILAEHDLDKALGLLGISPDTMLGVTPGETVHAVKSIVTHQQDELIFPSLLARIVQDKQATVDRLTDIERKRRSDISRLTARADRLAADEQEQRARLRRLLELERELGSSIKDLTLEKERIERLKRFSDTMDEKFFDTNDTYRQLEGQERLFHEDLGATSP